MPLFSGTKLGPYQIVGSIGAGGMGEVYRARDTRLDRTVAIKILPPHLASNPDLKQRFDREAKAISALLHPHICTLFDVGHQNGTDFLVMEYLEGETLAARLTKGLLPLDQVLQYAIQIADALDKAHRKGITHRDLKPGNIMLTKSGAKLLDFGLAKLQPASGPPVSLPQDATTKEPATAAGTILGTLQYMAPEQVEGKDTDARTDIFAFGVVVYEMATSKKAFEGKTSASLIAKILETDPQPISSLQPMTPPALDRLVKTCLAKDPDDRWQTARDLERELNWIAAGCPPANSIGATAPRFRRQTYVWIAGCLACLVIGALITTLILRSFGLNSSRPFSGVARLLVGVAPADQLWPPRPARTVMTLSPDGRHLVFSATFGGKQQLYLRAMDRLEASPMAGTENSDSPFFAPDGQWVGFWQAEGVAGVGATGELKKVPLNGGPAVALCKTPALYGASWGSNDIIVFANQEDSGLWQVSAAGGTPKPLTTVDAKKEVSHRLPQFLPGAQAVLFTIQKSLFRWDDAQIAVRSLVTGEQRVLINGAADARYVSGHLVYASMGTLMAAPFDPASLSLTGSPLGIVDGVMQSINTFSYSGDTGAAQFSLSESGTLIYLPGGTFPDIQRRLVWVDRNGAVQPLSLTSHLSVFFPRLSPDGQRVAFSTQANDYSIWIYDLLRGTLSRLTTEGESAAPIWTPDGNRVTFGSTTGGPRNVYWKSADNSSAAERLTSDEHSETPASWRPDGKTLALIQRLPTNNFDIWTLTRDESGIKVRPFLQTPFLKRAADFSPDGRWLAFSSNDTGRDEVYVQPYPGPGARQQISADGGTQPAWSRDGRELFYTAPGTDGTVKMMVVEVKVGTGLTASAPRKLFEGSYRGTAISRNYDVTPDGRRFLLVQTTEPPPAPPLTQMVLVQNWLAVLKQRVPTGK